MSKTFKSMSSKALSIDTATRRLSAIISTKAVDRDGDIVEPRGINTNNFIKNPIVLWAHNQSLPPIGKVEDVFVSDSGVQADIKFADTPFAKEIFSLFEQGCMNCWSIGFIADRKEMEHRTDDEGNIVGFHIKKSELLELSAVPVPSNPEALVRSLKSVSPETIQYFKEAISDRTDFADFKKQIEDIEVKAFTRSDHNNTVADSEPSWGSVDKTALPLVAHVWNANNTDTGKKSTWKYPHHWIQNAGNKNDMGIWTTGTMYLHKQGVSVAWAAAMGARSGQRAAAAVINHIQAHRKALGLEERLYYVEYTKEGAKVYKEKDFDEIAENESPYEEISLAIRENAFTKSFEERADNITKTCEIGQADKKVVYFLPVKEQDGELIEAKVLYVHSVVAFHEELKALTPQEPSRPDEAGNSDSEICTSKEAASVDDTEFVNQMKLKLMTLNNI